MLIKHYVTRAILFRWKLLPKDVIRFLNQTTSLKITKRSSGDYTFYHDFVRDYFRRTYQRDHPLAQKPDDFTITTGPSEQNNRSVAS
jgi:hypothetical protein